jgi:hypothetical protein
MKVRVVSALLVAVTVAFVTGCSAFKQSSSPASPSPPPSIDRFVGTWTSGTAAAAPDQCSRLDYTIAKTSSSMAEVSYDITCSGINVKGGGSGALAGSALKWTAWGNIAGEGIPSECKFSFVNNTATLEGGDAIRIDYSGTVCGVHVAGSQGLSRK